MSYAARFWASSESACFKCLPFSVAWSFLPQEVKDVMIAGWEQEEEEEQEQASINPQDFSVLLEVAEQEEITDNVLNFPCGHDAYKYLYSLTPDGRELAYKEPLIQEIDKMIRACPLPSVRLTKLFDYQLRAFPHIYPVFVYLSYLLYQPDAPELGNHPLTGDLEGYRLVNLVTYRAIFKETRSPTGKPWYTFYLLLPNK